MEQIRSLMKMNQLNKLLMKAAKRPVKKIQALLKMTWINGNHPSFLYQNSTCLLPMYLVVIVKKVERGLIQMMKGN